MIVQLAQIIALIPKVRPLGAYESPHRCEVCLKCNSDGQCPYCGRIVCYYLSCWDSDMGCCTVCSRIIKAELAGGPSVAPMMPPMPGIGGLP